MLHKLAINVWRFMVQAVKFGSLSSEISSSCAR